MDAGTIKDVIDNARLPTGRRLQEDIAASYIKQVLKAVEYLHRYVETILVDRLPRNVSGPEFSDMASCTATLSPTTYSSIVGRSSKLATSDGRHARADGKSRQEALKVRRSVFYPVS